MKICVTGGAGYIGSHTCKALAAAGHEVIVYDNLSTGHREFVRYGSFEHGDIRDMQKLRACFSKYKPDGVIHFAASAYVGESVKNPGKYFSNNVGGTLSLLEAMRDEGISNIVVSGTCAVYGVPEKMPISETSPTAPINPYGASKLFMERMLADFHAAHDLNWTSLRYFNAAGGSPEGEIGEKHDPETHLIPRVIMAALGQIEAIDIYGNDYSTPDGTCIRDYIHVDDLARAHLLAMERLLGGNESRPINLGTGKGSSVKEIILGISQIAGKEVPCRFRERRPGDPPTLIADATVAADILRWKAEKSLQMILEDAFRYFAAQ